MLRQSDQYEGIVKIIKIDTSVLFMYFGDGMKKVLNFEIKKHLKSNKESISSEPSSKPASTVRMHMPHSNTQAKVADRPGSPTLAQAEGSMCTRAMRFSDRDGFR
jgi:hypothetical protein